MAKGNRRRRRPAGGGAERPAAAAPTPAEPEVEVPRVDELDRTDLLGAGAVSIAAAALFLTTFSTHVALGDAPESVAGVKTFGVLHAPGYPSYVAVAGLFAHVVAIGSFAARVNGFSLLCAALTVGAVFLLARSFGASRLGAALGAAVLATSAGYWFNADFAKHYSFSGLLVTLAALAVMRWRATARSVWLVAAGALLGACAGASWELALIMAAGLVVLVGFGVPSGRAPAAAIAGAVAAIVVLAGASYGFMMWRASAHPAVNWGDTTTLGRVVTQVSQRDFRGQSVNATHHNVVAQLAIRLPSYLAIVARDIGLGAVIVALFGLALGLRGADLGRKLWIGVVAILNLVLVAFATGVDRIAGFLTGLVAGGYIIDLLVVVAVLVALGTTPLVDLASEGVLRATTPTRDLARRRAQGNGIRSTVVVIVCVIVLAPSLIFHYSPASHRQPPLADNYARRVFSELPHGAVLFIAQASDAFPIVYRQAVFGDRPDVSVVVTTSIQFAWYRDELTRELHLRAPIPTKDPVQHLMAALSPRPAFLDQGMIFLYRGVFTVKLRGLVGQAVASKSETAIDRNALSRRLLADDRADRFAGHAHVGFPNTFQYYFYARAHIELAKLYAAAHEIPQARTEIARSLDVYPDRQTQLVLQFSGQSTEKESKVIAVIEAM